MSNSENKYELLEGTATTYTMATQATNLYVQKFSDFSFTQKVQINIATSIKGNSVGALITFVQEDDKYRAVSKVGGSFVGGIAGATLTEAIIAFVAGLGATLSAPVVIAIGVSSGIVLSTVGSDALGDLYNYGLKLWDDFFVKNIENTSEKKLNKTTIHTKENLQSFLEENKDFTETLKNDNINDWTIKASMSDINKTDSLKEKLFYNNKKEEVKINTFNKTNAKAIAPEVIELNENLRKYDITVNTTNDEQEYTVMKNKTINKIAQENGISRSELLAYNDNDWVNSESRTDSSKNIFLIKKEERLIIPPAKSETVPSYVASLDPISEAQNGISKMLSPNVLQDINGRIKLLEYTPNMTLGISDGSYSVYEFEGFSCVSKPYEFHITFVSDFLINIEDLADTSIEFTLSDKYDSLNQKTIFGKIFKVEEDSVVASKYMYKIHVVSPMYYMGLNKAYEIFLDKRVPDIITEIVNRYSSLLNVKLDMKIDLNNAPIKEYTTRYNQSCLEFITMLCEQEGYSMIIDYSSSSIYPITLCELNEHVSVINNSVVASYNSSKQFSSSHFLEDFYDKDKPSVDMETIKGSNFSSETLSDNSFTSQLRNDIKNYKLHDNINELNESLFKDLNRYSKNDSQEGYKSAFNVYGKCSELKMSDCILIKLHDEKANKQKEVIVTDVKYYAKFDSALDEFISNDESSSLKFYTKFNSIPSDVRYKPKKITKKAKISGSLSAIVSNANDNPSEYSNEIDVDNEGRIRVIFHFEENKATSTYIRLGSIYAGDNYGAQFLPRVNQEVIVSFVNGNPDQPVVIASIHNGENKHANALPTNKSKSFIRTTSYPAYPDKLGYNEIGFEDKRDAEILNLRAQKDYRLDTQNSSYRNIDNNSKVNIVNDEEITIKNDHNKTIGNNSNRTIKANDIKTVENEEVHTIQEDKTLKVNKDFNTIVKRDKKTYIEKDLVDSIKNVLHTYIEGDATDKYLENFFIQVGLEMKVDISGSFHLDTTSVKEQASDISEIAASSGISLKCGANVLTINSAGIHFKTDFYNDNSANGGLDALKVEKYKENIFQTSNYRKLDDKYLSLVLKKDS